MVSTSLSKSITQPIAGLTFLALIAIACPSPTQAVPSSEDRLAQAPSGTAQPPAQAPSGTAQPPAQAPSGTAQPPAQAPSGTAQPPVQLQTETAQPVQPPIDYTLGGGDRIRVNILDVPEYTGEYQIPPGGRLYLPLIGSVSIRGLTQEQAADTIAAKYARFLKRPLVTVSLIAPRPINVVVSGEVNRPGSFTVGLEGGAGNTPGVQYPTVIGALALADGVTLAADIRQVQLRRREGLGSEQVIDVDLTKLVKTGDLTQDITLRDGDTIFIPTAAKVNLAELRQFATTNFAAPATRPRTVTVVGEVNRPGPYVVVGGATSGNTTLGEGGTITAEGGDGGATTGLPTVTRAIQLAGGITQTADIRNIQVRRPTKSGPEQVINVNLWQLLQTGDVNQDTVVQEGDSIVVPTATDVNIAEQTQIALTNFSPNTIQVSVVGEVKTPGLIKLPPNTPLNQALLSAGGFNNSRAKRSYVDMVRLNPDGTVTKRRVKIDLTKGINEQTNPTLRNNDIVVVNRSGIAKIGDTVGTVLGPVGNVLGILGFFLN